MVNLLDMMEVENDTLKVLEAYLSVLYIHSIHPYKGPIHLGRTKKSNEQ